MQRFVALGDGKQVSVPVPPAPAEREDPDLPTERPNLRDVHVPESGPNEDTEKGTDTEPVPPGLVLKPEPKKTDPGAVNALEKLEAMINPDEPQEGEQPSVGFSENRMIFSRIHMFSFCILKNSMFFTTRSGK